MSGEDQGDPAAGKEPEDGKTDDTFRCPHCKKQHPVFMTRCPESGQHIDQVYKMAGIVLEEKYQVGKMSGEGGMGVVYSGTHLKIGRKLAIKFLRRSASASARIIERFQNEARIAASVGHRNIVDILDMGSTEDGVPYIVMEYLQGNDLGDILDTAVRLPQPLAVDFAIQILSALRAVHEQGIIHRDLKPENAFIVNEAGGGVTLKIVDFGVSRLGQTDGAPLSTTRTGAVFGTPRYMAPEQARGRKSIDRRADLYACGVILYQMLSGALPFEAEDYNNLIIAITTEEPLHIAKHGVAVSEGLVAVVMKSIAREPDARFETSDDMIEALLPFRGKELDSMDPSLSGSIPSIPGWSSNKAGTPSVRIGETTGSGLGQSGPHDVVTLGPDSGVSFPSVEAQRAWSATGTGRPPTGSPAPLAKRRMGPAWMLAAGVVLVVAVLGAAAAYIYTETKRIEEKMVALATQPAVETTPQPVAEPEPPTWKVSLTGLPDGAEVSVDGTLHPERPLLVAESDGPRRIQIEADGYLDWERQVSVHDDLSLPVHMKPEPPAEEEESGKPVKKPGKKPGKKPDEKPGTKKKIDTVYPGLT
ncbi:MAG: serine/threonine protein kinase [Deltaproteobacteria bacterium]|nr:serine/threonine protein kinase [Deltaproteobacteria bacterium]